MTNTLVVGESSKAHIQNLISNVLIYNQKGNSIVCHEVHSCKMVRKGCIRGTQGGSTMHIVCGPCFEQSHFSRFYLRGPGPVSLRDVCGFSSSRTRLGDSKEGGPLTKILN